MNSKDIKKWLGQNLPQKLAKDSGNYPKISIITPCFNSENYLEETIRSVILQEYPNLEYIIVDGGSKDTTIDIIKRYEPWISYWVSEADSGQSEAINKGIHRATGEWVAWINADDLYFPDTFKTIAGIIKKNKTTSWVVGSTVYIDNDFNKIGEFIPELYTANGRDKKYQRGEWLDFVCTKRSGIALSQPASFWRREAVVKAGYIDETLQYAMDHELYGRLAYQGFRPVLHKKPLACFRIHDQQKSTNYPVAFWEEELKIVYNWAHRVNGVEKKKLEDYGEWLNRRIKLYPYMSIYRSVKTKIKKILKFMPGSKYK